MARPRKAGLDYFYKDVHDWDDLKIIDLVTRFGPSGFAVYDVVLCEIYKNGYYLETPIEKLALFVIRAIGSKWIKDKTFVLQVIQYCADIGLFNDVLLSQSVITSAEIQLHYSEVTARNKADKSKYWLLGESEKNDSPAAVINASENRVSAAKTPVSDAKTPVNDADMHQSKANKSKVNKSKVKQSKAKPPSPADNTVSPDGKTAAAAAADQEGERMKKIEKIFHQVTGRWFTSADRAAVDSLHSQGATDEMILHAMQEVAGRKHPAITSMKYFVPVVQDALIASYSGFANRRGMSASTSDTEDIEAILDAEWAQEVQGLGSGDYNYDDGEDYV